MLMLRKKATESSKYSIPVRIAICLYQMGDSPCARARRIRRRPITRLKMPRPIKIRPNRITRRGSNIETYSCYICYNENLLPLAAKSCLPVAQISPASRFLYCIVAHCSHSYNVSFSSFQGFSRVAACSDCSRLRRSQGEGAGCGLRPQPAPSPPERFASEPFRVKRQLLRSSATDLSLFITVVRKEENIVVIKGKKCVDIR